MFDPHLTGPSRQAYYDINDSMLNPCIMRESIVETCISTHSLLLHTKLRRPYVSIRDVGANPCPQDASRPQELPGRARSCLHVLAPADDAYGNLDGSQERG